VRLTGAEGGIAQELSRKLGATVIGPEVPTAPGDVKVTAKDGELTFTVSYQDLDSPNNNPAKQYSQGIDLTSKARTKRNDELEHSSDENGSI
jgi:hypothetical protein